ncbi:NACHT domain-containing protein [Streptomyces sp. NPDC094032]|uniref:NACHT domain-containing protein n=1 Tax=Streptomyces sp. NPDC094032 TaxID=3155308 RepID=UPI00331FBE31
MRRGVIGLGGSVLVVGGVLWALAGRSGALDLSQRTDLMAFACGALGVVGLVATFWRRADEDEAAAVARLAREVKAIGEPQWMSSLGGDLKAIDVTFAFRPYAGARAAALPASPAGRLEKVVEDYRGLRPRRLVITGEPGAGKTLLARKFVMELNRVRAADEPVPVLVALADWDTGEPFRAWLTRHLERDYGLPAASARRVVAARMVLPVLDGLDEMDPAGTPAAGSRAGLALEALSRHQDGTEPAPLVLTCRSREYDALEADGVHILDAARIEIDPVTPDRARDFLTLRGARRPDRWAPLLDELRDRPTGVPARALSTPWRLTLAAVAYERDGDPGELLRARTEGEAADLLLARFIGASGTGRYAPERVHRALHTLAVLLGPGTDVAPLELGRYAPRWLIGGFMGVVGVAGAAAQGLVLWSGWWSTAYSTVTLLSLLFTAFLAWHVVRRGPGRSLVTLPTPRLGSPLWGVGLRRILARPLRSWPGLLLTSLLLLTLWQSARLGFGARGSLVLLAFMLVGLGFVLTFQVSDELDATAVGPVGPLRGQLALTGLVLAGVAVAVETWRAIPLSEAAPTVLLLVMSPAMVAGFLTYGLFLLVNARRLPLRFARFLEWSVAAGLMRTSGAAYQFRHREFQEWLVRHPAP